MSKKMIRIVLIVGLVLLILAGGLYWWWPQQAKVAAEAQAVSGWGSIEAETLDLSTRSGGRIVAVRVGEGERVTAGQILLELDPAVLQAQQTRLEAALARAEANLAELEAQPRPEAVAATQAELQEAEAAREGAGLVWQDAQAIADNPLRIETRLDELRGHVVLQERDVEAARANLKKARIERDQAHRDQSDDEGITRYLASEQRVDAALGRLAAAEEKLAGTRRQVELLTAMRDNPLELVTQANAAAAAYHQAEARANLAAARLDLVQAGARPEAIRLARLGVEQARTELDKLAVRLDELTISAPRSGIILERVVEPGELASPGLPLLQLGNLEQVTLRIFVPETRIGLVKLGHPAKVHVDAYPKRVFTGTVSFIAQEAEYTPANVQTKEERVNLVFAVEIKLDNPAQRLMPGMPARADILVDQDPSGRGGVLNASQNTPTLKATASAVDQSATPGPDALLEPTLITPTATSTPAPGGVRAEIVSPGLNVRQGPGLGHPVVATLSQNDTVPVLGRSGDGNWLQIDLAYGKETGWISAAPAYVTLHGELATPTPSAPAVAPATVPSDPARQEIVALAEIVSPGLNVRQGPGIGYPVVATLAQGERVPVLEIAFERGWLRVWLADEGQLGWISGGRGFVHLSPE